MTPPSHAPKPPTPEHRIAVQLAPDHLNRLASARKPVLAVAELIWNALDADADNVRVNVDRNMLGGIAAIRVTDDGSGMSRGVIDEYFGRLGGSWKRSASFTSRRRVLHGKDGEGRFKAFSLGTRVEWLTRARADDGTEEELSVVGALSALTEFIVRPVPDRKLPRPGTIVTITNPHEKLPGIASESSQGAVDALTEHFALYLMQYPGISISYNAEPIDPKAAAERDDEYALNVAVADGGESFPTKLTIIEWKHYAERSLCLCDGDGFTLLELPVAKRLPGFNFTAYVSSPRIRELSQSNELKAEELHPVVGAIARAAREKIGEHFRKRRAEDARSRVEQWKTEKIYPYQGAPSSPVEQVERQVFDVCAANVESVIPEFETADTRSKTLTFRLLRQALEKSPEDTQRILSEVLDLPTQKQRQLAKLLDRTTLAAIINASSLIAGRLEFLNGLEALIFDAESKGLLKERTQLHRLLAANTWIFGEEFHLSADDEGLTKVLKKHLELLGKDRKNVAAVDTVTGHPLIVDLMLSRRVPLPRDEERQHLVVELKRPSVKITMDVIHQVMNYAVTVAEDERFRGTRTHWTFWALSSEMDPLARAHANQAGRAPGLAYDHREFPLTVWVKTWAQIIEECRGRLGFFQKTLEYRATHESGTSYLAELYAELLPSGADAVAASPAAASASIGAVPSAAMTAAAPTSVSVIGGPAENPPMADGAPSDAAQPKQPSGDGST